jgi:hypothetical protein
MSMATAFCILKDLQDAIEKVIEWTNAKNLDDMRDQHRHIDMSMSELLPTFGVEFEEKEC